MLLNALQFARLQSMKSLRRRAIHQGHRFSCIILLLLLVGSLTTTSAAQQALTASQIDQHELYYGAHLTTDRTAARRLALAEELLEEERFSEAIPLLLSTLHAPLDTLAVTSRLAKTEDAKSDSPTSLKRHAATLLADLPPAGRQAYELEVDARSQRELLEAMRTGSLTMLRRVMRDYPQTAAAADATWLLASEALGRGQYWTACALLERLRSLPQDRRQGIERSLMLAVAYRASGEDSRAREVIETLSSSSGSDETYAGELLLSNSADVLRFIEDLTAGLANVAANDIWAVPGGDAHSNPVRSGSPPHPWPRWSAMSIADPRVETQLNRLAAHQRQGDQPIAVAAQAVAAGDQVVMRSEDRLVAIDFLSGKRVWETRPTVADNSLSTTYDWEGLEDIEDESWLSARATRTWFDAVGASLATDGRNVYAVERLAVNQPTQRSGRFGRVRGGFESPETPIANRLAAYSLAEEGKLVWRLGGEATQGRNEQIEDAAPASLSEAYILGAPHPLAEQLAVIAEIDQSIILLLVDSGTGRVRWRQPLVSVERGVSRSAMRRMVGSAMASDNGYLYCSTGAGVIVAIDTIERSIAWIDRLPASDETPPRTSLPWRRQPRDTWPRNSATGWRENRILVVGDRVLVATPESRELHCLSAESGEVIWRQKVRKGIFLTAATESEVLVGTATGARAYAISDGSARWRVNLPADAVLSGRGLVVDKHLLLPQSDRALAVVDLAQGKIIDTLNCHAGGSIGNLILHRGTILSQTHAGIDRYDQADQLLAAAKQTLVANPTDVSALCTLGEAAQSAGDLSGAVEYFARAHQLTPLSALARSRLRDALLTRLRVNGPNAKELAQLRQLVDSPQQRLLLLLESTKLAVQQQDLQSAVSLGMRVLPLVDSSPVGGYGVIPVAEKSYAAPTSRIAGLIEELWHRSNVTQQQAAAEMLREFQATLRGANEQEAFARVFRPIYLQDAGWQREADERLATAMGAEQRLLDQAWHAASLDTKDAQHRQSIRDARSTQSSAAKWATHQVTAQLTSKNQADQESGQNDDPDGAIHLVKTRVVSPAGWQELTFNIAADSLTLQGTDGSGKIQFYSQLGSVAPGFVQRGRGINRPSVWQYGPCLFLTTGSEVVALETLPGARVDRGENDRRLWSTEAALSTTEVLAGPDNQVMALSDVMGGGSQTDVLAVSASCVVIRRAGSGTLAGLDPLTGALLWARADRVFGEHAIVVGSELFVTADGDRSLCLRLSDGADAGTWDAPAGEWIFTSGQIIATMEKTDDVRTVRTYDVATAEQKASRSFNSRLRWQRLGQDLLLVDNSGRCELVSGTSGQLVFGTDLPAERPITAFTAVVRSSRLYVTVGFNTTAETQASKTSPLDGGIVTSGETYCLSPETGESLWPAPVRFANRGWLTRQPRDAPVLFYGARKHDRTGRRGKSRLTLLAVDAATGRTIYRNDELEDSSSPATNYSIAYRAGVHPQVTMSLPRHDLTLRTSEWTAAPTAPANDFVEAPAKPAKGVDRFVERFRQLIGDSIKPQQAKPKAEP